LLKDEAIGLLEPFEQEKFRILTVLRDARPDQFLFTEGKLSGVIDFGAVGRDIVAVDLARLASEWFPDDFSQQLKLVNSYVKNRIIDEREFRLIRPLALSGAILGGLAWIDLHFRKRRSIGREAEFDKALDHAILRMLSFYDSRG
jgi:Ser/Thr protein kinase RdoA (MazF antagonist)